jgi:hypothetical protein
MMMNDNTRKWVKALRSGEFEQGRGRLRDGDRYCCLGVACELYRREHPDELDWEPHTPMTMAYNSPMTMAFAGEIVVLPVLVQNWLSLSDVTGGYDYCSLSLLNDEGRTFDEIATTIESEPEGLFR